MYVVILRKPQRNNFSHFFNKIRKANKDEQLSTTGKDLESKNTTDNKLNHNSDHSSLRSRIKLQNFCRASETRIFDCSNTYFGCAAGARLVAV